MLVKITVGHCLGGGAMSRRAPFWRWTTAGESEDPQGLRDLRHQGRPGGVREAKREEAAAAQKAAKNAEAAAEAQRKADEEAAKKAAATGS